LSRAQTVQPVVENRGRGTLVALLASLALHGLGALLLSRMEREAPAPVQKPLELVVVEVEPPKPPPPPEPVKEPEPPKPEPVKVAPKPAPKPPPVQVAEAQKPPPPPSDAPPPPNDTPPPEQPPKPAPLVVGISMSSTSSAGSFAAPVGNTLYGKTADRPTDPDKVQAYSAPKYTPLYQVDQQPRVLVDPKVPYPEEARRAGMEGSVVLAITIDPEGKVVAAKVVKGNLGYGLDEAALKGIRAFHFSPATKNGEPVSTTINFTYTFLLDD
jgi:periplasmic protein TonB